MKNPKPKKRFNRAYFVGFWADNSPAPFSIKTKKKASIACARGLGIDVRKCVLLDWEEYQRLVKVK